MLLLQDHDFNNIVSKEKKTILYSVSEGGNCICHVRTENLTHENWNKNKFFLIPSLPRRAETQILVRWYSSSLLT